MKKFLRLAALATFASLPMAASAQGADSLLNVSYDVSRGFYQAYNPAFVAHHEKQTGKKVTINQSHGGSGRQARAVIEGLEADVVTMNSPLDIDIIARDSTLVAKDWANTFPHRSAPSWSTTLFVVRKGNPKKIRDWGDLAKPGVQLVAANPKTSGNGRYVFLGAAAHAHRAFKGDEAKIKEFLKAFYNNFPILPTGGRDLTTAFVERRVGDALLTFEAEALLLLGEFPGQYEIVVPPYTVSPDFPVAVVDKFADAKGTRAVAEAYAKFLFSEAGQELAAKYNYRVVDKKIAEKHKARFPKTEVADINGLFGEWSDLNKRFFGEDGWFDQLYSRK